MDFTKIPFDRIVKFGQRTLLYRDLFTVSWLLGRFCNYSCTYCWPYARSDTKDFRPTDLCIQTMEEIKRQARENGFNSFHFSFSGGEPTMHPGYLDILQHYVNDIENTNYQSCHMTSNISQGMRWFQKYVDTTKNLHRVSVTASWHREQGIKQGDLKSHTEKFADKLEFLQQNDVQVTINTVMVPEWFWTLYEEAEYFQSRGINVTLKPQSNTTATKIVDGYTDEMKQILYNGMPQQNFTETKSQSSRPKHSFYQQEQERGDDKSVSYQYQVELEDDSGKKWYLDQAERMNAFEFNRFKGWNCNAGHQGIIIREPDGFVKRSYSCSDLPLGHIETGFHIFKEAKPCITESCVSSADSKIPKWRND